MEGVHGAGHAFTLLRGMEAATVGSEPQPGATHAVLPRLAAAAKKEWSPALRQSAAVAATLAVMVLAFVLVNVALRPKRQKVHECATPALCRRVKCVNTVLSGVRACLNVTVAIIGGFVLLGLMGVNVRALLATAGVLSLVLGLAAQGAIRSAINAVAFALGDRFALGDWVELALLGGREPVRGAVKSLGLQFTTLRDEGGAVVHVFNGNVVSVTNYSQGMPHAVVDVRFPAGTKLADAHAALAACAEAVTLDAALQGGLQGAVAVHGVSAVDAHGGTFTLQLRAPCTAESKPLVLAAVRAAVAAALCPAPSVPPATAPPQSAAPR